MFSWVSYEAYTVGASPSHIAAIRTRLGQAWAWRSSPRLKCPCKKWTSNKTGCLFGCLPALCACMGMVPGNSMRLVSVNCCGEDCTPCLCTLNVIRFRCILVSNPSNYSYDILHTIFDVSLYFLRFTFNNTNFPYVRPFFKKKKRW